MLKDRKLNGFLAKVNIIDPTTGEVLQKNKLNVPNRLELVEWIH